MSIEKNKNVWNLQYVTKFRFLILWRKIGTRGSTTEVLVYRVMMCAKPLLIVQS